ncbi:MAG TPA: hemolysin III family protein [Beijerinckiaceae bacterium]
MKRPVPRPAYPSWNYSFGEILADGAVHVVGIVLGLVGAVVLIAWAAGSVHAGELTAVVVYAAALLAMLGISAAYNLWPVSDTKWILRRFDHSAIYVLIAGTYTPLMTQMKASVETVALLAGIWATALVGAALKLALPGRLDRISILLYLALGWSGVAVYDSVAAALPASALWLVAAGGLLYSGGVVFHVWSRLPFQNAIWHAFVLAAAACHWGAVLDSVVLARS